jgi:hypothetical protein
VNIVAAIILCLVALPIEWCLVFGTAKLLGRAFPLSAKSHDQMERQAKSRRRRLTVWLGILWAVTIALYIYIFI